MDFVDKENVSGVQVGEQRGKIPGLFDGRAGGDADVYPHLVGDDPCQGGFAQTGRAVEQGVIQRLIPAAGGFNIDGQVSLGLLLPGVVRQQFGAQPDLPGVLGGEGGGDDGGSIQIRGKF